MDVVEEMDWTVRRQETRQDKDKPRTKTNTRHNTTRSARRNKEEKNTPEKNHPPFRFNGKLSLTGDLPSFRVPYNPAEVNHFLVFCEEEREFEIWPSHASDSIRHISFVGNLPSPTHQAYASPKPEASP
jgi:hypothetical protein